MSTMNRDFNIIVQLVEVTTSTGSTGTEASILLIKSIEQEAQLVEHENRGPSVLNKGNPHLDA